VLLTVLAAVEFDHVAILQSGRRRQDDAIIFYETRKRNLPKVASDHPAFPSKQNEETRAT
jgi:hypothetical protein